MNSEMAGVVGAAGLKTAPPVAISTLAVFGAIDMTFLVALATFVYVIAQLGYLIWKWVGEWRARRKFAEKLAEPLSPPE